MYRRSLGKWVRLTFKLMVHGLSARCSRPLPTQPAMRYSSRPLKSRDPRTALELKSGSFFGFFCITNHSTGTQHIRKSPLLVNDI